MMANKDSWSTSRHAAATKINLEASHLKVAMEHFIVQMTSVTLETLGLQGPRTRAGTPNHKEILAELQTQLQEAQAAISTNRRTMAQIDQKGAKKHFLKVQYFIPKLISNGTQNHFWP